MILKLVAVVLGVLDRLLGAAERREIVKGATDGMELRAIRKALQTAQEVTSAVGTVWADRVRDKYQRDD